MNDTELKIGGLGGQGVILTGIIIGKAATLYDEKHATMIQSFGPEARGSACSTQLILSETPILYPYVTRPYILMVMSQDAFNKFYPEMNPEGHLLIEAELVNPQGVNPKTKVDLISATRIAEELGRRLIVNIVMLGFFAARTNLLNPESIRKAVLDSVPTGTEELNLKAYDKGFQYGQQLQ
ncbi:MAG: pyruvate ferredoxin oxidoreductase [Candidatus Fischerbacteria bacterium RBG_13_37_8]|uniref:Pyruvate ferredoxin oxidoreductase n=1 Tax=Candidatus Fischerbacteria bacterium RBG_13_37_8 TaxID=1817863 RepID=A0A1F5VDB4_9BACT|nr:MAG: pyruvate ferredoxin oxidoreductase [Candidatus Fischerbacteria bacterium RBG_13_37_8]